MDSKICNATNVRIANDRGSVIFKCPSCQDADIIRSTKAREIVAKYVCPKCGFEGPN